MSYSTMMRNPLLISSLLDRGPQLQPDNLLVTKTSTGYSTITYREHFARTKQLARALEAWGARRADRVATFCWNTNRHLQVYHAVPSAGYVLHTLNIRLGGVELGYIIRFANDRVVVCDATLLPSLAKVSREDLAGVELVVVCGKDERPGGWEDSEAARILRSNLADSATLVDWDAFLSGHPPTYTWPRDLDENDPMALCFTSGTTGNPKGVVYSHRGTYLHTLMMPQPDIARISGTDTILPVVPYFHANGWGIPYVALMVGARVVHNNEYTSPEALLEMACDRAVTFCAAVPAIWQISRTALEREPERYRGRFKVNQIICGGSAPPDEMMKWYWDTYKTEFLQVWGMTETTPLGTIARQVSKWEHLGWDAERRFSNVTKTGLPVPTVEIKIVDSSDFSKELPHDGA